MRECVLDRRRQAMTLSIDPALDELYELLKKIAPRE